MELASIFFSVQKGRAAKLHTINSDELLVIIPRSVDCLCCKWQLCDAIPEITLRNTVANWLLSQHTQQYTVHTR